MTICILNHLLSLAFSSLLSRKQHTHTRKTLFRRTLRLPAPRKGLVVGASRECDGEARGTHRSCSLSGYCVSRFSLYSLFEVILRLFSTAASSCEEGLCAANAAEEQHRFHGLQSQRLSCTVSGPLTLSRKARDTPQAAHRGAVCRKTNILRSNAPQEEVQEELPPNKKPTVSAVPAYAFRLCARRPISVSY